MKVAPSYSYVSTLINLIARTYHYDSTSICVLWNDKFPYQFQQLNLDNFAVIVSLYKPAYIDKVRIPPNRLDILSTFEEKLAKSINYTHCESFIVFEDEITMFVNSFMKSVLHSVWRSVKNKFLFVYTKDRINVGEWNHIFFKDINNILVVEMVNETFFILKTTKYVGSRFDHPEQLVLLDTYSGLTGTFESNQNLYPDKLKNLMGREIIAAAFAYEPFSVLKNASKTTVVDVANGNRDPSRRVLYDGTDAQALFHLCWLYNCTVQVDTSETGEWGYVFDNFTGNGALGLVFDRKADISMMAMYMWYEPYVYLDISSYLSRNGILCFVPAPRRIMSWFLPLEPFHWLLWLGIIGCLILESIGLLIARWAERTGNATLVDCFYFGYATSLKLFVSQGSAHLPSSVSVRIVLFSCYMIDIILTSIYSGGLASILTIPSLEEVADSFDRMAKYNQIWVATSILWIQSILETDDKQMKKIMNNFKVLTWEEIRNRELIKTHAFVVERIDFRYISFLDYIDQEMIDGLKLMIDDIYSMYCVGIVPRTWAPLVKFDNLLLMMHSSGLTSYIQWKVVSDNMNMRQQKQMETSVKTNLEDFGPMQLDTSNFIGILLIWIFGVILSFLVFIGEVLYYRYRQHQKMPVA